MTFCLKLTFYQMGERVFGDTHILEEISAQNYSPTEEAHIEVVNVYAWNGLFFFGTLQQKIYYNHIRQKQSIACFEDIDFFILKNYKIF